MAHAIWKGAISFGLVSIPVDLVSADISKEISFHLLDKRDFSPVGYERVSKESGRKVAWDDIVKGYEHAKGEYVVLTDDELKAANVEATQSVDLLAFVDRDEIDPMFFDRPYYLVPSKGKAKGGAKAYTLLRETLKKTNKVGIGNVVLRTKAHLCAIVPRERTLALVLLRYADELRDERELEVPEPGKGQVGAKELALAEKLVEGMVESWDPSQYRDDFREDVMALIDKKVKAGEFNSVSHQRAPAKKRAAAPVVDLVDLLEQSVGKGAPKKKVARTAPAREHVAHHRKSA